MKLHHMSLLLLFTGLTVAGCAAQEQEPAATAREEPEATHEAADAIMTDDDGTRVTLYVTEDGFVPANVTVPAGMPVTLMVTRKTERTCATALVMGEYDIKQELPLDETVEITFTPEAIGDIDYACGMDMIKGKITVE